MSNKIVEFDGKHWEVLQETDVLYCVKHVDSDEVRNISKADQPVTEVHEAKEHHEKKKKHH